MKQRPVLFSRLPRVATTEPARGRREFLAASGALGIAPFVHSVAARAESAQMAQAIREVVGDATVRRGRVTLDVPPLVENGNSVSIAVGVDSPMTPADHVRAIHVFNEKNPQPNVISMRLGPRAGRAQVALRIRLSDTQKIVAIAELSDGSFWSGEAEAIVTLSACLEG